jgi:hypothetical protein
MIVPTKNWLVVKKYPHVARVSLKHSFNILTCSHLSSHLLAELKLAPNRTNIAAQSKYVYMTQEAIKTRKQNCDDSLVSSKRIYLKYERN